MKPRLISHHLCPYVQRAVIVLTEKDIEHDRVYIDLSRKPAWFATLSPLGRVPVLQVGEAVVFESQVIAEYLDEVTPGSLHPADPLAKARHRSWIEFGSETLNAIGGLYNAGNARDFEQKRAALKGKFDRVDRELEGPYFAGRQFHLVDGVWGTVFRYLDVFDAIADFGLLDDAPAVRSWREHVSARPSVATASPNDYPRRLQLFLRNRRSHISALMRDRAA